MVRTKTGIIAIMIILPIGMITAGILPDFTTTYTVKMGIIELGEVRHVLTAGGNDLFTYESIAKTSGFIAWLFDQRTIQSSSFKYRGDRIIPVEYRNRTQGRKTKNVWQKYDWNNGSVSSHVDDKVFKYQIPPDTLDQNIYQLSLMLDLAQGKRQMLYHIAEDHRLKSYLVQSINDTKIDTLFGSLNTVVIRYKNKNSETTLWCAKDLAFLPVRIDYEDDGGKYSAFLTSVDGLKPAHINAVKDQDIDEDIEDD